MNEFGFISEIIRNPGFGISWIMIIMFSICLHEYAHAYVALRCGDDTAAEEGHLTLDPLVQMGPMSLVILFVVGIAWGAVPVNEGRMRKRYHPALVAAAGPAANLVLCFIFAIIASVLVAKLGITHMAARFFYIGSWVNGALCVLNLMPIPPLDGWTVLGGFVPAVRQVPRDVVNRISFFLILILFLTPAFSFVRAAGETICVFFMNIVLALMGGGGVAASS